MGVYIKSMDMPKKCGLCDLFHAESPMHCTVVKGHKTVGAPYGMPRPDWCPLVEITAPHGKLIDADKFKSDNPMHMELDVPHVTETTVEDKIDDAPIVIEAEE